MAFKTIVNLPTEYLLPSDVATNLKIFCDNAESQNLYTGELSVTYDENNVSQIVQRWDWATEEVANEYVAFINANVPVEKTITVVTN